MDDSSSFIETSISPIQILLISKEKKKNRIPILFDFRDGIRSFETVSFFSGAAHSSFVFLVFSSGQVARVSPFILTHDRAPDPNKQHTHRSLISIPLRTDPRRIKNVASCSKPCSRSIRFFDPFIDRLSIDRFVSFG